MVINDIISNQNRLCNWIKRNLKSTKTIRNDFYDSAQILSYVKRDIPQATHEEFKQAMARCGFYADCSYCDETYNIVYFNVSRKSIWKLQKKEREE